MINILSQLDRATELECENEKEIIYAFMERYDVTFKEAQEIFNETKKWLWLASKSNEQGEVLFIDKPLLIIDEMWHTFILHTKQYYQFCISNFKKFIHHTPTPVHKKKQLEINQKLNPSDTIKKHENQIKKQYELIYDNLGPETLLKWYDTMAQKYTPDYIHTIKK